MGPGEDEGLTERYGRGSCKIRAPAGSGRWTDVGTVCGGAQVRDARDLVLGRQTTAGTADHDGGFSFARAPPHATKLAGTRVAVRAEDPSRPFDSDVATAVEDVLTVLRAADAKVSVQPASLPVDIAANHQPALLPLFQVRSATTASLLLLPPTPPCA
ncbi:MULTISPECIES: hypothetical protein [unclassified Streptomyces]|uniref:hypothetical protein n=1 Tax=unclassified Streptomyces TaxID=2593676 RepID=UPI002DDC5340|nr:MULTISPECIES: hypothetical protein [unclassified Streptomyces]WSA94702.1 amidase family protein [Streptomyces sp. NBC_01795]WSB79121.1 amidase family protein [Streptomyces sp. NBC_01775]WSS12677.1 amidase family protein [Streptomyces sp. NBC_01186]WSS41461.1 amidase family protein [Streptomyces sp. NBC_01187]